MYRLLIFFLVIPSLSYSQYKEMHYIYDHSFGAGINYPPIDLQFPEITKAGLRNWDQMLWNVTYKLRINEDHGLRSSVNLAFRPDTALRDWMRGATIGYEYYYNAQSEWLQWFVGGEAIVFNNFKSISPANGEQAYLQELDIGAGPVVGVKWHLNARWSLISEIAWYAAYRYERKFTNIELPEYYDTRGLVVGRFTRFASLGINYHFNFYKESKIPPPPDETMPGNE
jgi:hypothetical protein